MTERNPSARRVALCVTAAAILALSHQTFGQNVASPSIVVGPNLRTSSNTTTGSRNECWISASQSNPNFLIAVAQATEGESLSGGKRRCSTMVSRNGGQTWREIRLPDQVDGAFDPMTAVGPDGRVYVMHTLLGANAGAGLADGESRREGTIRIWSTTDDGVSWGEPTDLECPLAPDHPRMVVDDSNGPHRGRLYVAWNEVSDTFLDKKYHIFLHYSDDGGKTFSKPRLLEAEDGGKLVTTEPVVLSDGTLLVTYYQYFWPLSDKRNDAQPFYILRSTDGGQTFGEPEHAFSVGSSAWRHLRRDFGRAFTLPIIVADTSGESRFRDRIYAVWDDVRGGESNIWFSRSLDQGRTWDQPARLNDNPQAGEGSPPDFRMTPVVAVNQEGTVGVAWYDRREDPAHRCWKQYFTASVDGGQTFLPNVAVSSAPSCPAKDVQPSVYVWNKADDSDETLPTEVELAQLPDMERRMMEETLGTRRALKEASAAITTPRIRVAFDSGRNAWPGHYSGLTTDTLGRFHALWADRRNDLQQLYTARIEVASRQPVTVATHEADISELAVLLGGPGKYDAEKGTTTFELQVRNVSEQTIYGPIRVRVKVLHSNGRPTATILDHDGSKRGKTPAWDFSKMLGSAGRLEPGQVSEARRLTIKTTESTGLDGLFEFDVTGHLAGETAAAAGRRNPQ